MEKKKTRGVKAGTKRGNYTRIQDTSNYAGRKASVTLTAAQQERVEQFRFRLEHDTVYDPKLDDGVDKHIAPLQAKGLLKSDVLKKIELKKYLNAGW